jgi:ribulose-phosphate 3-epimerase
VNAPGHTPPRLADLGTAPRILPSLLSADFAALGEAIAPLEAAGAQVLHLDVMDGHFVPNITFGPPLVQSVRKSSGAFLDVHLMISEPLRYLEAFARAGAGLCTLHAETGVDPEEASRAARGLGLALGVSLRPSTELDPVLERWARWVDLILVMSVEPGFGGQGFHPEALPRLRRTREVCLKLAAGPILEVDGGIGPDNTVAVVEAGAHWLVAGHAVFRAPDPVEAWSRMTEIARAATRSRSSSARRPDHAA